MSSKYKEVVAIPIQRVSKWRLTEAMCLAVQPERCRSRIRLWVCVFSKRVHPWVLLSSQSYVASA